MGIYEIVAYCTQYFYIYWVLQAFYLYIPTTDHFLTQKYYFSYFYGYWRQFFLYISISLHKIWISPKNSFNTLIKQNYDHSIYRYIKKDCCKIQIFATVHLNINHQDMLFLLRHWLQVLHLIHLKRYCLSLKHKHGQK